MRPVIHSLRKNQRDISLLTNEYEIPTQYSTTRYCAYMPGSVCRRSVRESTWVNDGDHWLIQSSNVLPDSSHSTAEHVLTKVDDNKFSWESQNRTLNGDPQPSLDKIEVQRVQ